MLGLAYALALTGSLLIAAAPSPRPIGLTSLATAIFLVVLACAFLSHGVELGSVLFLACAMVAGLAAITLRSWNLPAPMLAYASWATSWISALAEMWT